MKALSLWQPWATALAEGLKGVETRSWSTKYRGWVAIHAAKRMPPGMAGPAGLIGMRFSVDRDGPGEDWYMLDNDWPGRGFGVNQYPIYLPLGAVVAVGRLVDVVPMVDLMTGEGMPHAGGSPLLYLYPDDRLVLSHHFEVPVRDYDVTAERPWGLYEPGRCAWLFEDVRKLPEPIPCRGRQGLFDLPADVAEILGPAS